MEKKHYAVAVGRKRGIVETWNECKRLVHGYHGAVFKSFPTLHEAQQFLKDNPWDTKKAAPSAPLPIAPHRRKHSGDEAEEPNPHKKPRQATQSRSSLPMGPVTFLYTDGACQDTRCGAGFLLKDTANRILHQEPRFLANDTTNNEAEYDALILGLQACLDKGLKSVEIRLDSMLVVEQSKGNWRINEERLERRWKEVQELLSRFDYFRFEHIDRSLNQEADALSKLALRL